MEIKYENWERMREQMEATIVRDAMNLAISQNVLDFVEKQRDKCEKPEPIPEPVPKEEDGD